MIGDKVSEGDHFYKCLTYNAREKNQAGEKKAEWVEYRNLSAGDPTIAAKKMKHTASKKIRDEAKDPLYHYVISWHKNDNPTKEQMLEAADRWLEGMGLDEHQVQIASHVDTDKPHLHFAINRVHPENHKSWNRRKDLEKSETLLKEMEQEFGWEVVPGKHHPQLGVDLGDKSLSPEQWMFHYEDRMNELASQIGIKSDEVDGRVVRQKCEDILDDLFAANSFKELDQALDQKGLWLEQKGNTGGMVFTDGRLHVKASDVARDLSGPKREEAYQESLEEYVKWREGELDLQAAMQVSADWKEALDEEELKNLQEIYISRLPQMERRAEQMEQMNESYKEQIGKIGKRLDKAIDLSYENPNKARKKLQKVLEDADLKSKYSKAEKAVYNDPEQFGEVKDKVETMGICLVLQDAQQLQGEHSNHFLKLEQDERDKAVKDAYKEYNQTKGKLDRIKRQLSGKAQQQIEESEAGEALSRSANTSLNVYRSLRVLNNVFNDDKFRGRRNYELDQRMLTSLKGINETFDLVYEDPEQAKAFFSEIAWNNYKDEQKGIDHIADLAENPEKFGDVALKDEVHVLVDRLREPEQIRQDHRSFINGLGLPEEMWEASEKEILGGRWILWPEEGQPVFNFGKHKGDTIDQVLDEDPAYIRWCQKQNRFPRELKSILKGRQKGKAFEDLLETYHDFVENQPTSPDEISYMQQLPLQYANDEKMVGGLKAAGELNRWIGMAARSTEAGRAIFKMSSLAIRYAKRLSGLMAGATKAKQSSLQSLIKDNVSFSQVRAIAQNKVKQQERDMERGGPEL